MQKYKKILLGLTGAVFIGSIAFAGYVKYLLTLPEPEGFPILEYHLVQAEEPDNGQEYNISPEVFIEQLEYLKAEGYTTISIRDFLRAKKGLQELPAKPIILTFDDGYESNYTELLPILEKYNVKATIFMVTNEIGNKGFMNWSQLKDIQRRGVEIGSHTANHLPITGMNIDKARDEVLLSKLIMEWNGMDTIYTFSYPNGKYNDEILNVLKEEEYLAAVTGDAGLNTVDTNPYLLQRINIPKPHFGIEEFKWRLLKGRIMTQLGWWQH